MIDANSGLDTYLPEVKELVLSLLGPYPVRVYLFGSYARGDYRVSSDVDIAVTDCDRLPPGLLLDLKEALEESNIPYRVDVVDLQDVDEGFRRNVLKEGIVWKG